MSRRACPKANSPWYRPRVTKLPMTNYGGTAPLQPEDIVAQILYGATLPAHLNDSCKEVMPVRQAWAGFVIDRN